MSEIVELKVRVGAVDAPVRTFVGRFAWTLKQLIEAGERGCTPIERPAPRWSHYVFPLRRDGVAIQTIEEKHGGAYAGRHARQDGGSA